MNAQAKARLEELQRKLEAAATHEEQLSISSEMDDLRHADNVVQLFPEGELIPFPLDVFDEPTREMVLRIAQATENPVDPVAFVAFNMMSATYGAFVRLHRKANYQPWCCDYACLTGGSGVGKSPIFSILQRAIYEVEATLRESAMGRVNDARALIARLEADKRLLTKQYKGGGGADSFEADIRKANDAIEEAESITMPEILLHDVSPEAMLITQCENDDTASMVSAETPIFSRLLGRSTGKPPDIDALLSSYDGETYRVKRVTRAKNWVDEARLSILGGTQLSVIEELGTRPDLWDRGLVNRFWFCVSPEPTLDDLQDDDVEVPDELLKPFREKLVELGLHFRYHHPVEPYDLSDEAAAVFRAWRNRFKRRHRINGDLHHITGFCRKLEDKVLRWATNIHAFANHKEKEVSRKAMDSALLISQFALSHFLHVYAITHGSQTSAIERSLRTHLARKKGKEITLRDIKNGLPSFHKAPFEAQEEALNNLAEDGFLRRKEVKAKGGGRPSLRVVVL